MYIYVQIHNFENVTNYTYTWVAVAVLHLHKLATTMKILSCLFVPVQIYHAHPYVNKGRTTLINLRLLESLFPWWLGPAVCCDGLCCCSSDWLSAVWVCGLHAAPMDIHSCCFIRPLLELNCSVNCWSWIQSIVWHYIDLNCAKHG